MFLLEGTIGAGKSTFLRLLKEQLPEVNIHQEPVHSWDAMHGGASLLGNFYQDPQRWAYTFETFALFTRFKEHLHIAKDTNAVTIAERSLFSGHYVFAHNSYAQGLISDLEWQLYTQWFNFLTAQCSAPQGFIYLRVEPEVAYARIQKRARIAENTISFEYVKQICDAHDSFLLHKHGVAPFLQQVPVITIECSEDFGNEPTIFKKYLWPLSLSLQQYST